VGVRNSYGGLVLAVGVHLCDSEWNLCTLVAHMQRFAVSDRGQGLLVRVANLGSGTGVRCICKRFGGRVVGNDSE